MHIPDSWYNKHSAPKERKTMHTPGPWYAMSGGDITTSVGPDWVKHLVAKVYNHEPATRALNDLNSPDHALKEMEANQNLVAAAPELLEACKNALSKMNEFKMLEKDNHLARVIAKAQGKGKQ